MALRLLGSVWGIWNTSAEPYGKPSELLDGGTSWDLGMVPCCLPALLWVNREDGSAV